jgi:hypothetical protein
MVRGERHGNRHATTVASGLVMLVVCGAALLGGVLLAASFVPSATLAGRVLAGFGEARGGTYTQELLAYLDERLRFAAVLVLVLAGGLLVTRRALEDLLAAALQTDVWPRALPSRKTLVEIGVPTLVAAAVRVPFLGQPMRYDEALTFNEFASRPLYYGLSFYPDPNNHLLNTLLMSRGCCGCRRSSRARSSCPPRTGWRGCCLARARVC